MTQRVGFRTRLKQGMETEYDTVHASIPPDLELALRQAGVRSWEIWREGQDLFHIIDCDT